MSRTSRLWRRTGATEPLFNLIIGATQLNDRQIKSININRGGEINGFSPATAEIPTTVASSIRSEETLIVRMTTYGANLVATLAGASETAIRPRFHGRVGKQSVTDTPERAETTFYAASWEAQLSVLKTPVSVARNDSVGQLTSNLMRHSRLPGTQIATRMAPIDEYGTVEAPNEDMEWGQAITKYVNDTGVFIRPRRSGGTQSITKESRRRLAVDRMSAHPPLTRSHAISPTEWEQPVESFASNHRVLWATGGGFESETYGQDIGDPDIPVTVHDMQHVKWTTNDNQPRLTAASARAAELSSAYRIPSITIDLLYLMTSSSSVHRHQAARLLAMEVGDPLYFSGDWLPALQGIQYAVGMDESISPDGWELTLILVRAWEVDGTISPDIPPLVWDSATYAWNNETRRWDH